MASKYSIDHGRLVLTQEGARYLVQDDEGQTVATFEGRLLAPLLAILQEAEDREILAAFEDPLDELLADTEEDPLDWDLEPWS